MENIFDICFDNYINLLYATGGHNWTSLNNGTAMYYYNDKVYYEGKDCFNDGTYGYLYFIVDNKVVKANKDYKKIGYVLSLNLAIYLLERADGKIYSVNLDREIYSKFVISTNKGVYEYYDTANFYQNQKLIEYLCKAFEKEMNEYKLKELNP